MSFWFAALLLGSAALAAVLGCSWLSLSQPRHWRTVIGVGKAHPLTRPLGWGLIGLSWIFCMARDGASFAALLWPLLIAGAALIVAMTLAYRPRVLSSIAIAE
ncbi:MAG: DUF3325 domain-containing protein [Pseudomonadota bacterium]